VRRQRMRVRTQARMRRHKSRWRKPVEIAEKKRSKLIREPGTSRVRSRSSGVSTDLGRLELVMGKLVGYGLRKPAFAGDKEGYMVGVCLRMIIVVRESFIAIRLTRHGGLGRDLAPLGSGGRGARIPVIEERLADQPCKIAIRGDSGGKQITSEEKVKGDRALSFSLSLFLSLLARRRVTDALLSSRGSQEAIPCIRPNRPEPRG